MATPKWLRDRREPPPNHLRGKPLPEWSREERDRWEPPGKVWDEGRREWRDG